MYQVIVSNVGVIYSGDDAFAAVRHYNEAVNLSHGQYGRWANEEVTMLNGDVVVREWAPAAEHEYVDRHPEDEYFREDRLNADQPSWGYILFTHRRQLVQSAYGVIATAWVLFAIWYWFG